MREGVGERLISVLGQPDRLLTDGRRLVELSAGQQTSSQIGLGQAQRKRRPQPSGQGHALLEQIAAAGDVPRTGVRPTLVVFHGIDPEEVARPLRQTQRGLVVRDGLRRRAVLLVSEPR